MKFENSSYHLSFSTLDDPFWVVSKTVLARKYSFVQHVCNYYLATALSLLPLFGAWLGVDAEQIAPFSKSWGPQTGPKRTFEILILKKCETPKMPAQASRARVEKEVKKAAQLAARAAVERKRKAGGKFKLGCRRNAPLGAHQQLRGEAATSTAEATSERRRCCRTERSTRGREPHADDAQAISAYAAYF